MKNSPIIIESQYVEICFASPLHWDFNLAHDNGEFPEPLWEFAESIRPLFVTWTKRNSGCYISVKIGAGNAQSKIQEIKEKIAKIDFENSSVVLAYNLNVTLENEM